jgi:hypothetical protein
MLRSCKTLFTTLQYTCSDLGCLPHVVFYLRLGLILFTPDLGIICKELWRVDPRDVSLVGHARVKDKVLYIEWHILLVD